MKIKFTVEANVKNGKLSDVNVSNVTKVNEIPNGYVDLGLPSGTLWAKCNYGADKEVRYDIHYTWDEAMRLPITLPTKEQFEELLKYTNHQWIERTILGVNGMVFVSKVDPTKYIFIPASGRIYSDSVYGIGSNGRVWSSSLSSTYSAWYLDFNSGGMGVSGLYNCDNSYSVRGVISK